MTMDPSEAKEMWPTLNEAHGHTTTAAAADDIGWEIVRQDDDDDDDADESDAIEIQVVPTSMRKLRHCASSPDLRFVGRALDAVEEHEDEEEDVTIATTDSSAVLVSKKATSFLDAILSPSRNSSEEQKEQNPAEVGDQTPTRPKPKTKPKFVVTPIKRCAKSTGDLRSLVIDEDEVLGETDAMDYYHRKAMGAVGRVNGLKIRPDEAKRKEITLNKKQMQREQQARKL